MDYGTNNLTYVMSGLRVESIRVKSTTLFLFYYIFKKKKRYGGEIQFVYTFKKKKPYFILHLIILNKHESYHADVL